ncbi:unnamed protein product [Nesidiocoris tenuis]|uniref:Dolichyl-diphosphooligosaccharide--protein glycosyltransferase subunit 1 n=1 Tax=Nesidiocoris tenuis TaxID=355587 RepID=A0A6H5GXV6_9HEMI|nr:unnamed protein product [Nesidiocoris tenuis]
MGVKFDLIKLICAFICVLNSVFATNELIAKDLIVKNIDRSTDVSTQLVKVTCTIQIENTGKSPVSKFLFSIEPNLKQRLSYISAQSGDSSKSPLAVQKATVQSRPDDAFWKVDLREPLGSGSSATIEIDYVLTNALSPYPTHITQKEKQLVKFIGSYYAYLPYLCAKQTTTVSMGTKNVESYSKLNPVVAAFSVEPMTVHYENNNPFLKISRIERTIEVSHWGNIAIEETIDLEHTGAVLKGPFSRYDFQREMQSGLSSVKSFKTVLPASATDAYYRDEIGNISTSHMRIMADSVELDLRPRFPLFGGWKTHYVLGYNVPSYEYLFNSGDNYKLKIRVLDHIFDDMVVDELITKVILPEGAENINLVTPYSMTRHPDTRHSTYLDTKGRPVITVSKRNLVENHIQALELDYVYPRILMLQEPVLVALALYALFLLVIVYVRMDFSISKDEAGESRLRVSGILDKLLVLLDKRAILYMNFDEHFAKVKTSKDVNSFNAAAKTFNQEYKNITTSIADMISKLKPDSPEASERVAEIQKLDKVLKEIYNHKQALYVDKLLPGKISRSAFVDAETGLNKKKQDAVEKINAITRALH